MVENAWLAPGERILLELSRAKLEALDEFGTDVSGQRTSSKQRHLVAEAPRLVLTEHRMVFVNHLGEPTHQTIYDLGYLRAFLKFVRRWNEASEARIRQAEAGETEIERWLLARHDRKKFGLSDNVDMLTYVEHPRGLLGPKPYLLLTESTFRPVSAERQQSLEAQAAHAQNLVERAKLRAEAREVGMVFSYKPAQLFVHEKDSLDAFVAAVTPKVPAVADYVTHPEGLESDYSMPSGTTQGLATYRPQDPEGS